jgi:surface polysaccharide O-acyltransferase-like enzyme
MANSSTPRLFWPDFMRACAMCMVVLIHICGAILNAGYTGSHPSYWWIAESINAFTRTSVPLFFMLSGAMVIGRAQKETPILFLRKRLGRIVVSFLVWSCLYLAFTNLQHHTSFTFSQFLHIAYEPTYYHLWFFYSIIGLYLFAPILGMANPASLRYLFVFWFISISIMFFLEGTIHPLINGNFTRLLPTYIGYFAGGYLLQSVLLKKNQFIVAWIVFGVVLCITIIMTGILTIRTGGTSAGFYSDYLNVNVVVMSIALFLILRTIGHKTFSPVFHKTTMLLSQCGLGIYVIHPLILGFLASGALGLPITAQTIHPLIGIPLTFLITVTISTAITFGLTKIPVVKTCV